MFSLLSRNINRAFSTTASRSSDVSKLILVGRLGKDPEVRISRTDKEYVSYTVATANFPPPQRGPDGTRAESKTTWHHVLSFNPSANNYLRSLQKGSHVYVEASFELREPDPSADSNSPYGQRQIFLRHENIRLLRGPPHATEENIGENMEEIS
ncbi:single-strand binding protein family-domain-containing protein [Lactarius quietus]|nr:single-strand binding protein family-domain-containing protein [Lactarius quietus]